MTQKNFMSARALTMTEMEKGDPIKTLGKKSKNCFAACAVRIVME